MKKNAFDTLQERGFIHSVSHEKELREALGKGPVTFYLGIDPTADNLHIGHFFALQVFKILQDHGHKGILLIGNATAMVGDPSGKSDMRKMMTQEEVDNNAREINVILHRFIDVKTARIVHNADWTRGYDFIDFARNICTYFNLAEMFSKDCYKNRLGTGLTLLEILYMPMQANDFLHLNNTYGCTLQIGGSDQWSNILAGVELGRKVSFANDKPRPLMIGMCNPLLTKADGTKMGKTEKGVLWVSRDKTSTYDCYQHFLNVYDEDVEQLLRFFTMLPIDDIKKMCKDNIVEAKKTMALAVTEKIHGETEAQQAQATAQSLFTKTTAGGRPDDVPTETIKIERGANIVELLALTSIIQSKRQARELVEAGAILVDGEKITDTAACVDKNKTEFLIKKGKKTFLRVTI